MWNSKVAVRGGAVAVSAFIACLAAASPVTGQVFLANGSPAKNAVIWLEGPFHSKPLKGAMIDQRNLTFIPHVSVVTVGTTVRFPNNDTVFHNVFAEFEAKRFDLGMYPQGSSKTKTFDKPGLVAMFCSVHSNMSAYLMVVDTPYYAIADKEGKFKIPDAPDQGVEINVWHESNQRWKSQIGSDERGSLALHLRRQ